MRRKRFSDYLVDKMVHAVDTVLGKMDEFDKYLYEKLVNDNIVEKVVDKVSEKYDTIKNKVSEMTESISSDMADREELIRYDHIDKEYIKNNLSIKEQLELENDVQYAPVPMTETEYLRLKHFMADHKECMDKFGGNASEAFEFVQDSNGIGRGTTVTCRGCGKRADLTDYDSW